jgi:hypothetical protein
VTLAPSNTALWFFQQRGWYFRIELNEALRQLGIKIFNQAVADASAGTTTSRNYLTDYRAKEPVERRRLQNGFCVSVAK